VLEYYPQPCKLHLEFIDQATGEIHGADHTPDFLVIREDGFTLEEWKTEVKLARLAAKTPYRYAREADGQWRAPQIERRLSELGLRYRIYSDASIPRRRVENLSWLADYYHPAADPCPLQELRRLKELLAEHGSVFLADLFEIPYRFKRDDLFKAIADQEVVTDLDRELLSEPRRCRVYRDAVLRDFIAGEIPAGRVPGQERFVLDISKGASFAYDGKTLTISLVGEEKIVCTQGEGQTLSLTREWPTNAFEQGQITPVANTGGTLDLARYTEADLNIALKRQAILRSETAQASATGRTERRWSARQKAAQANGAHAVLALVPQVRARGNRTQRLTSEQERIMLEVINLYWRSHEAINAKACHRQLVVACSDVEINAPSYKALRQRLQALNSKNDLRTRHGKRMAYQLSEFVDVLYYDTPQHGSRPFQYVHIDHTQADIELISGRTEAPLGRPWLSLAVDAWSRRIVAFYLSYDPPSYHSVMMVMRDMVRRHARLPEFIVVDNGRDFMSTAFETFLQVMGVHLRFRPAGQPRHGAVLERLFGRVHSEYIHNLSGNTKATKNVRMTTGKHLPVNFANWTLENLNYGIEYWATEHYDQDRHPALDCSPREAFMRGMLDSGDRPQRRIRFGQDFLIATCPPVDREGVRRVHNQRGVKVNGFLYWSPEFRDSWIAGERLPVRYDPWDASSVYVRFRDRWIRAVCRNLVGLGQLTELERRSLTEEYTHRSGQLKDDDRSAQRLSEFMRTFSPGQAEAFFDRQRENKALSQRLGMGSIHEIEPVRRIAASQTESTSLPEAATNESSFTGAVVSPSTSSNVDVDVLPKFDTF
jgi:putative transposase